jgi:DNA-directed RNA polymerase subunit RPC12/RpoP
MTNDMDELESEVKRLCSDCVGEVFVKADIQKNGRDDACSYCESKGKTFSIAEMADRIDHAIDQHFYLTSTEPSGLEYGMIKEGDLDWKRKGEPIADIIQEYAQMEPGPADDIRSVLEGRHSDRDSELMGYENPFDEEAHYAESEVDDWESQAGISVGQQNGH